MSVPVAVFASGGGTNLQALLNHDETNALWHVELVVSDRPEAGALARAQSAGKASAVIKVSGRPAQEVEAETLAVLEERGIQALLLAGYLRLLPPGVVDAFPRRILNIHPALLPAFGGKGMFGRRVHEAVLESGAGISGVTVHYVDASYDTGTILAQWPVPVLADDTPDTLGARVLAVEHFLYPHATDHVMRAVAEGRTAGPFQPEGSVFTLAHDAPEAELARQLRGAFRRR